MTRVRLADAASREVSKALAETIKNGFLQCYPDSAHDVAHCRISREHLETLWLSAYWRGWENGRTRP